MIKQKAAGKLTEVPVFNPAENLLLVFANWNSVNASIGDEINLDVSMLDMHVEDKSQSITS